MNLKQLSILMVGVHKNLQKLSDCGILHYNKNFSELLGLLFKNLPKMAIMTSVMRHRIKWLLRLLNLEVLMAGYQESKLFLGCL